MPPDPHAHAAPPHDALRHDAESEVMALERRRYQAMLDGDLDALDGLLAEELSYAHSSGARDTKDEYLAKIRSGYYDYLRIEHPVERVEAVGDAAIVVGRMTADLTVDGTPKSIDNLALAVWVRTPDGWRLVAYAPTTLPA